MPKTTILPRDEWTMLTGHIREQLEQAAARGDEWTTITNPSGSLHMQARVATVLPIIRNMERHPPNDLGPSAGGEA